MRCHEDDCSHEGHEDRAMKSTKGTKIAPRRHEGREDRATKSTKGVTITATKRTKGTRITATKDLRALRGVLFVARYRTGVAIQTPPTAIASTAAENIIARCGKDPGEARLPAEPMTAANAVIAATVPTPKAAM